MATGPRLVSRTSDRASEPRSSSSSGVKWDDTEAGWGLPPHRYEMTPLGFKCAFVTRGEDGEIAAADAETLRSASVPHPAHEALAELDPGKETRGRQLTDMLARGDATINGAPVSLMGTSDVLELLGAMEVIKAREDKRLASSWSKVHWGIMQRTARECDGVTT